MQDKYSIWNATLFYQLTINYLLKQIVLWYSWPAGKLISNKINLKILKELILPAYLSWAQKLCELSLLYEV